MVLENESTATPSFTASDVSNDTTLTFEVTVSGGSKSDINAVNVTVPEQAGSTNQRSAHIAVTPNDKDVDPSIYLRGSFQIGNASQTNISSVTFNLSTASMPDMVFASNGTAGDGASTGITVDNSASTTGLSGHSFTAPQNGPNSSDGYDTLQANFTDFESGETFTFSGG